MGSFSIWHWVIVIVVCYLVIAPFWKIFGQIGLPRPLALLAPFPFAAIIFLWVVAYRRRAL